MTNFDGLDTDRRHLSDVEKMRQADAEIIAQLKAENEMLRAACEEAIVYLTHTETYPGMDQFLDYSQLRKALRSTLERALGKDAK